MRRVAMMLALVPLALTACDSTGQSRGYGPYAEPAVFPQPFNRPAGAPQEQPIKPDYSTYNPVIASEFPDYRLNVGDILELIFHVRTGVTTEEYRLKSEDQVSITFPFQRDLDQDVLVQSDGRIRCLLVGSVVVIERGTRGISR